MGKGLRLSTLKPPCVVSVLLTFVAIVLPAQTFTTLVNFNGTNGSKPVYMSMLQGIDGDLYGTTSGGGAYRHGTVFKMTRQGRLTTLHNFDSADGQHPWAGLVQTPGGLFYGTTFTGGVYGNGSVFSMIPGGVVTTIHSFSNSDGAYPIGALVSATDGNYYATTVGGGAFGYGTVFAITPTGTLTTLHSFDSTDGANPRGGLLQARNGNFYGSTEYAGANGDGTIFQLTPLGALTTLLDFKYSTYGANPNGGLVQAVNGNIYGITAVGGANGYGTIFQLTTGGALTTLHSFDYAEGCSPNGGLIQATDGALYGTTYSCGANGAGTIYQITLAGTLTVLHNFDVADGAYPSAGLVQATDGKLYGTTWAGGAYRNGTIFKLSIGLGPFVDTLPTFGKVGAIVKILGTNLNGAISVTFNGVAAAFAVEQPSEIAAIVPIGATTGMVQVTTPTGTLKSNVKFQVVP